METEGGKRPPRKLSEGINTTSRNDRHRITKMDAEFRRYETKMETRSEQNDEGSQAGESVRKGKLGQWAGLQTRSQIRLEAQKRANINGIIDYQDK